MAIKLAIVILTLSIVKLAGVTLLYSLMEVLAGIILALQLKRSCLSGGVGRDCYPCSINRSANKSHSYITNKNN